VADATAKILARVAPRSDAIVEGIADVSGIYHLCSEDSTSWFGFAQEIVEKYGRVSENESGRALRATRVIPISSAEYPSAAKRPRYSVLSPRKIADPFGIVIPSWRDQLDLVLGDLRT